MTRPTLFLDISRLVRRYEHFGGPTGIDRIELRFAEWLNWQDAFVPRAVTLAGPRLVALRPEAAATVVRTLTARWNADRPPQHGQAGSRLAFAAERAAGRTRRWRLLAGAEPLVADGPNVTLSVGHDGLDEPGRYADLPGPFAAVLSDIIPITHPEYETSRAVELHRRRLDTLRLHATHLFTISEAARQIILTHAGDARFTTSVFHPGPGLEVPAMRERFERPTFVHLSSLDRRKNVALLLHVWRELAAEGDPPALLVIGRRGNDQTVGELIDRCASLAPHVSATGGLGDAAVAAWLAGARALLTPSFAEGFGLPIVEAHLMGVPVIASDIPPHREIGGVSTTYLSPLDGSGWKRAIRAYADGAIAAQRSSLIVAPAGWDAAFAHVTETLLRLAGADPAAGRGAAAGRPGAAATRDGTTGDGATDDAPAHDSATGDGAADKLRGRQRYGGRRLPSPTPLAPRPV